MEFKLITSVAEMDSLAGAWNELLPRSATNSPFLRYEYLRSWWLTLGGGEWKDGALFIVTGWNEGQLAGIAPLFRTHDKTGEPILMLLGSIEISDFLDLIVPRELLHDFTNGLMKYLVGYGTTDWQIIDLYNVPEDSPSLEALNSTAEKLDLTCELTRLQPTPYIPLPGDWDTYLAGINKKQRHEIRRKMRRASEHELPVRWYIVDDETHLDSEIEAFLNLMANDSEKANFLTEIMRSQMRSAVHAAFREGWLQLSFLEVDGKKACGYLNFDYDNRIWVYNSGLDFKYGSLSPGWVLLGHLLQWANENGRSEFDFMRGDEEYKYRFGAVDRFVLRVKISR